MRIKQQAVKVACHKIYNKLPVSLSDFLNRHQPLTTLHWPPKCINYRVSQFRTCGMLSHYIPETDALFLILSIFHYNKQAVFTHSI